MEPSHVSKRSPGSKITWPTQVRSAKPPLAASIGYKRLRFCPPVLVQENICNLYNRRHSICSTCLILFLGSNFEFHLDGLLTHSNGRSFSWRCWSQHDFRFQRNGLDLSDVRLFVFRFGSFWSPLNLLLKAQRVVLSSHWNQMGLYITILLLYVFVAPIVAGCLPGWVCSPPQIDLRNIIVGHILVIVIITIYDYHYCYNLLSLLFITIYYYYYYYL